jgi:Flp pilus assembly protein TadB
MKRSIQLILLLGTILAFSSCSRQYAHMTRTKVQFAKSEVKEQKKKRIYRKIETAESKKLQTFASTEEISAHAGGKGQVLRFHKVGEAKQLEKRNQKQTALDSEKSPTTLSIPSTPALSKVKKLVRPTKLVKEKASQDGRGLLYIILVVILVLVIIGLIRDLLGPALWSLIVLVALIALLGILLGWW